MDTVDVKVYGEKSAGEKASDRSVLDKKISASGGTVPNGLMPADENAGVPYAVIAADA